MRRWVAVIAVAVGTTAAVSASSAVDGKTPGPPAAANRYSLAHGCYALYKRTGNGTAIAKTAGPFRFQPSTLGVYLLYGRHKQYLVDQGGGKLVMEGKARPTAEWRVTGSARRGFSMANRVKSTKLKVRLVGKKGCAQYPEAQVDAIGRPFHGASPGSTVRGTMEGHAHITAFELFGGDWHCGRPYHRYGAPYSLPGDCSSKEQGTNGQVETFLDFQSATRPSDMHGWPTFKRWPSPTALAEEGDYYTGIERAWKAGLRLLVTDLVDNEALCKLMTRKRNPCNDMASVHIQSKDLYGLEHYVDAQSGGPGNGWFRVVTDPFQARRVINQGKLAVIEGVEVSRILGCGEQYDVPQCNKAQIDAGLKDLHRIGVRTFFPVHEFDNAFGGTKMIAGEAGAIVNAGNREETGSFWSIVSCPARVHDEPQVAPPATGPLADLLNGPVASLTHGNPIPVYPPPPHCNTHGLTDLGAYLIGKMAQQHFIVQTDHMSSKTADAAVGVAEKHHYAGIVSAHCCASPQLFARIYKLGGYVNPPVNTGSGFVGKWKFDRAARDPRYDFGFGWGSDMNGLATQPGPTIPLIKYPFKSYDGGVKFTRERWGQRVFDYNKEGLANYGLYADWLEQVRRAGGRKVMNDMFHGAESFLQMWERADGVPTRHCQMAGARFKSTGLGSALRLGDGLRAALFRGGQPAARPGRSYRYCVAGGGGHSAAAVFDSSRRVSLVASNAPGASAGGIAPGASVSDLVGRATRIRPGVWVGGTLGNGARYVYVLRNNLVAVTAVAAARDFAQPGRLAADLHSAHL